MLAGLGTIGQRRKGVIYHGPHTRTSRHWSHIMTKGDESRSYDATVQTLRMFFGLQKAAGSISLTLPSKVYAIGGQTQCYWRANSMLL